MVEQSVARESITLSESEKPHLGSDCLLMLASQRDLELYLAELNNVTPAQVKDNPRWAHQALFSDIDNSYRNSDGSKTLDSMYLWYRARERGLPTAFVTGNALDGVLTRAQAGNIPFAEVEMVQAGMQIYFLHTKPNGDRMYVKDLGFEAELRASGYDRLSIAERSAEMIAHHREHNPGMQLNFQRPEIELAFLEGKDPAKTDQPFKMSFYAFARPEERFALLEEMRNWLPDDNIDFMICEEIGWGMKNPGPVRYWCIDALAKSRKYGSGKAAAIARVCDLTGIEYGIMIVDSGNDTPVYDLGPELTGIVPVMAGGARQEMREKTVELAMNAAASKNPADPRNRFLEQVLTIKPSDIAENNETLPLGKFVQVIDNRGTPKLVYVGLAAIGPESGRYALNQVDIARQLTNK